MNRQLLWRVIAVVISIAWLFAVTFTYYIAHKPFAIENVLAILNALGDVLVAGTLFALPAALGRCLLRRMEFGSLLEQVVFSTGLGLGLVAFATFALGLVGLLHPVLFWALLLVAAFLLRGDLLFVWRDLRAVRLRIVSRFERALALFCGFALTIAFFAALTPPTAWDALQYHLVGPQLALAQGRIAVPPDNLSLSNPALVEMLFLAAMLLKGDIAAQLIHFSYLFLLLGAMITFAQRYLASCAGWLAAALLLAVPSFLLVSTWAYNDVALAFYAFGALYLTMLARATNNTRWFVLAGIFAGLAMSEKYTAAIVAVALVALIARPRRAALFQTLTFGLSAVCVAAPWYIRNWIFTGNPIYPFVWGGLYWDAFRASWYSRFGTGLLSQPLQLLAVPWSATILGSENAVDYQATIGPLLLALVPLWLLTMRAGKPRALSTQPLWWFVAMLYLFWLIGIAQSKLLSQTRLLFPAFPVLALLAADAFDRLVLLELPQFSIRRFASLVVGLVLGLTALSYALSVVADRPLGYIVGVESRAEYLARHLDDYYSVTRWVNSNLPTNARIFCLWETRAYYFERRVNADAILDRFAHWRYLYHDADAIARALRREGYTHLLLNRAGLDYMLQTGYDPITTEDMQVLQDLTARHLRQVYGKTPLQIITHDGKLSVLDATKDAYAVYEIVDGAQ